MKLKRNCRHLIMKMMKKINDDGDDAYDFNYLFLINYNWNQILTLDSLIAFA